ncbi:MAG: polysaccharide deacetylase family protein [Hyphomicrobium sp.]
MKKLLLIASLLLLPLAVARAETVANVTSAPATPAGAASDPAAKDAVTKDAVTKDATAPDAAAKDAPAKQEAANCANALGVSRTIEIDTAGGGEYGEQYPPKHLLEKGEVVLTFDDGPHPEYTRQILAALAAQCTKATFFNVGEMIKQYPDISREVQAAGHTIGTHTYTHRNLGAISLDKAKTQIESTINEAEKVLPEGVAPFFRFPYLSDPKRVREYLASRNIAVFGIDIDSYDWRVHTPEKVLANVTKGLDQVGGGIILFHDIHPQSAKAVPAVPDVPQGPRLQGRAHGAQVEDRDRCRGRAGG